MNIILVKENDFITDSKILLKGRRAEHVVDVLKPEKGQSLRIGIINGKTGRGKVVSVGNDIVKIEVEDFPDDPPQPITATLIIAMQRPKTLRKIIQSATAFGVKIFYIIESWKVEKSYWSSPLLRPENLKEQAILGLEQAGDTVLPSFKLKRKFKPFVEDELPALLEGAKGFAAHPYTENPCPKGITGEVVVAIGPEGGFTDYEIDKMEECGMKTVSLGERTLRSEFAVTAILAKLF